MDPAPDSSRGFGMTVRQGVHGGWRNWTPVQLDPSTLLRVSGPTRPYVFTFRYGRTFSTVDPQLVKRSLRNYQLEPRHHAHSALETLRLRSGRAESPSPDSRPRRTPKAHFQLVKRPLRNYQLEPGHPAHSALETLRLRSGRAECPTPDSRQRRTPTAHFQHLRPPGALA